MPTYTLAVQNAVPINRMGQASSGAQFFRQIGSSLGAALMGAVLVSSLQTYIPKYLPAGMHGANGQFSASRVSGAGKASITSSVHQTFGEVERQVMGALAGDQKAYAAVQGSRFIPASYKAKIPPGGVPAEVRAGFAGARAMIAQAMAGNPAAQRAVQQNPEIPAQVKAIVQHPPRSAAARQSVLAGIDAQMQAAEPQAIATAVRSAQSSVRSALGKLERQVTRDLLRGLDEGVTQAERSIFLYSAVLALLALVFALLLPNAELSHKHQAADHGREPDASP